jgi:hypothetical protein
MEKIMNKKRRFGDRKDGVWLKDLDSMHLFVPYIYTNRTDAEAFIQEKIDLTAINVFLARKNENNPDFRYTMFQLISAAILKTVILRPRLNRFIAGRRFYQRNHYSIGFVAKKQFSDHGSESLLMLYFDEDFTLEQLRGSMNERINGFRHQGQTDNSTDVMDVLTKMPRCLLRIVAILIRFLDYFGKVPQSMIKEEPNYATVFLTNLGSIKLNAGYHHLNNFGTNSIFVVIGEKKIKPWFDEAGNMTMRDTLNIGFTLDERIADGYYYAQSIKLFKHLLEHPELLELPANEEVNYE